MGGLFFKGIDFTAYLFKGACTTKDLSLTETNTC